MASTRPSSSASGSIRHGTVTSPPPAMGGSLSDVDVDDVPVDVLVEHLLAAKRGLSSFALLVRANELATLARDLHEDAALLSAQTSFLRCGIASQTRLLLQARGGLARAFEKGRREFRALLHTLDSANAHLETTMDMLRNTVVDQALRPEGETAERSLLDFVDEQSVEGLRDALKDSVKELQAAQTLFSDDLARFDHDLTTLDKMVTAAAEHPPLQPEQPLAHLLSNLAYNATTMAKHLSALNNHFDMCVTAVRITDGGAALARQKAAEAASSRDGNSGSSTDSVSISGVIARQESGVANIELMTAEERARVVQVVMHDAPQVDDVVAEMGDVLHTMELDFATLSKQVERTRDTHAATRQAFVVLEGIAPSLSGYIASGDDFAQRWGDEKAIICARLEEMEALRRFYEGYASAYDSLLLEVERRRGIEEKMQAIWRKAQSTVDKLIEEDEKERIRFRQDVGEFMPADLWLNMAGPLKKWKVMLEEEKPSPVVEQPQQQEESPSKQQQRQQQPRESNGEQKADTPLQTDLTDAAGAAPVQSPVKAEVGTTSPQTQTSRG